ncbi:DUF1287 domain-containing protein [Roseibium sp. SCP14]|uniref:DUF1287 domain-containing protein n=1 Tax=Roseibium sp. SCP14 TaxID=3141375 RepID=UPI003339D733
MNRRDFLIGASLFALPTALLTSALQGQTSPAPEPWAEKLIAAAERQIGETIIYDPAYVGLSFPNGDIPRERGVCTDVVIRAYRDAFGFDLQLEVNKDMKAHFRDYPRIWGLKRPDRNIDHRRVPNLQTYFKRQGAALPISDRPGDYVPGDIISQMLPGNLPHIAIVTNHKSPDGKRPMLVHNIGAGTRLEDRLFDFKITGRYRLRPKTA